MLVKKNKMYLFGLRIDRPAIAVTVSDSSFSLLAACTAVNPTVCASFLTHGQCDIYAQQNHQRINCYLLDYFYYLKKYLNGDCFLQGIDCILCGWS